MKPTAQILSLLFIAGAVVSRAADSPATTTPPPEPAAAPTVTAPAATEPTKAETAAAPAPFNPTVHPVPEEKPDDPNVLKLPKMVVKQKPRPRLTPEVMITRQGFGEELAKKKYTALDQALNKWTLPLFGTSMAERALEDHEREKKQEMKLDVLNMVKALDTVDPTEAKSLKEAATRP